jgi:flagellar biogenesis protein FliO
MNSNFYISSFFSLIFLLLIIGVLIFLLKKIKGNFIYSGKGLINILDRIAIDRNKFILLIEINGEKNTILVAENYSLLLNGGESRIRTYERARRADLQSAAFGHSAISPKRSTKK